MSISPSATAAAGVAPARRVEPPEATVVRPLLDTPGTAGRPAATVRSFTLPVPSAERQARLEQAAFDRGYAAGERAGAAAATAATEAERRCLIQALDALSAARRRLLADAERDVVQLAVAIAERILTETIAHDPQRLIRMAAAALARIGERRAATLRVHPEDLLRLNGALTEAGAPAIALAADATLPSGGAVLETSVGTVDLRLDAQLQEILHQLLEDATDPQDAQGMSQAHTDGGGLR